MSAMKTYCPNERCLQLLAEITPKSGTLTLMKEILIRTSVKQLGGINKEIATLHSRLDEVATVRVDTVKSFVKREISKEEKQSLVDDLDSEKLELQAQLNGLEAQQTVTNTH